MSKKDLHSMYQEQKNTKPKIEDVIPDYLDGDMKTTALDFVAYMRTNKMSLRWASVNAWKANYKGKGVCYVRLDKDGSWDKKGSWVITPIIDDYNQYEELIMNEGLQNVIWDNLYYCINCHPTRCAPGRDMMILGKKVKGICKGRPPAWFWDPNEVTINCVKKLLDFMKQNIEEEKFSK